MSYLEMLYAFGPFVLIMIVFWFILIRPERKRQKTYGEMIKELKVNDKIITKGGIIATIIRIDEDELIIESERTKLKIAREAVGSKIQKGEKPNFKNL